jgi:hypothetical protein
MNLYILYNDLKLYLNSYYELLWNFTDLAIATVTLFFLDYKLLGYVQ